MCLNSIHFGFHLETVTVIIVNRGDSLVTIFINCLMFRDLLAKRRVNPQCVCELGSGFSCRKNAVIVQNRTFFCGCIFIFGPAIAGQVQVDQCGGKRCVFDCIFSFAF